MYGLIKICFRNLSQFQHCIVLNNIAWLIVNFSQLASRNLVKCQTFKVTLLQLTNKTSRGVCALCIEADAQYRRFEVVFPQKLGQWSSVLDMYG